MKSVMGIARNGARARAGGGKPLTLLWALCAACALGGVANPPPPEMPRVLVDAPVAARLAANHTAQWKTLGAAGFLFHGIYDTLDGAPQGGIQDFGPTAPESALLKELRLSVAELEAAGLDRNFLRVGIAPDAPWFSDRAQAKRGVDFFEAAGIFCARAGLRGIALDLRTSAPFYRYDWPGYGPEPPSSARLQEAARDFGRRGLRVFYRQIPDAEVIFLADDPEGAGPLWMSLFEGLIESVGAAASLRLDLAVPIPREMTRAEEVLSYLEALDERLCAALGETARHTWQLQGGYVPVLTPLAVREGIVGAGESLEDWRNSIAAAKLAASDYVAVRGAAGTWWSVGAKQARGYAKLKQAGAAQVRATPDPLEHAEAWDFRTPFDALQRVGPLRDRAGAPYVFLDTLRSAVLFWEPPKSALETEKNVAGVPAVTLGSRAEHTLEVKDGKIDAGGLAGPTLLRGLPINEWAGPAAVWCAFDATPGVGAGRVPVRLGVRNVSPGELNGALSISLPGDLSLGTHELPVLLKPGASAVFERGLQGTFDLGESLNIGITLRSPLSPGVTRSFHARAHLKPLWQQRREGALHLPPLIATRGRDTFVIAASEAGDVAGYTTDGTLVWQRRYPPPLALSAWTGRAAGGASLVAVGDAAGGVHVLEVDGAATRYETKLPKAIEELLFADLFALGSDALFARTAGNELVCLGEAGRVEWRFAGGEARLQVGTPARVREFAPQARVAEDRLYVATAEKSPRLLRLAAHGQTLWSRALPQSARGAPAVLFDEKGIASTVLVPVEKGPPTYVRADIGADLPLPAQQPGGAWSHVKVVSPPGAAAPAVLAMVAETLVGFDPAMKPLWRADTGKFSAMAARPGLVLGLSAAGGLVCTGEGGARLWKDVPPVGLRALSARTLPGGTKEGEVFIAGTEDGYLMAFPFPPVKNR